ncbi:TLC domain-containing protein 3A isoform X3 [Hemicordylus capensis]|nr:TLC domain-containing protein 3A isoform X3 [Hemicordylus capensis]XP_053131099.1 TLC domain-containing protein 3A isoform X3 [Hemicordylus capensis]XP_053131100.1 TLC domain-containing protein 3A isoform X3 [Hemicordylus capensis]XP_053131101.1 TLC domain-containing protein 3A isoform X3 [Hemicordylus capensis]
MSEAEFEEAATMVKQMKTPITEAERLEIYSLYKQALLGDCSTERPPDSQAKARWEAWSQRKGLSRADARKAYITLAEKLKQKYGA